MMRKYQKGGTKWYYPKEEITDETPYYNPSSETLYINPNYTDDQVAIRQHELFHHLQNINGGLQLPQYYNGPLKKPNIIMNGEIQGAYYNRRGIDEENMYNKMIKKSPELQFVPRDILYNGIQGSKGYIPGTDALMYEDPTTAEGEARDYENYIIKGGKTMFPNQTINEYKSGGKWIQGAVKNPGRCTPGSPNYDCPEGSPQWRLAQTFKKHHGFHKKEDLKKYQGGGPTTSDSLALYNNSEAKIKFFKNNSDYKNVTGTEPGTNFKDPKIRQRLIKYADKYSKDADYNKVTQPFINSVIEYAKGSSKPLNAKEIATLQKSLGKLKFGRLPGTNLSILGDVLENSIDTWYNPVAPPIYIHPNIKPQGSTTYSSKRYGDLSDIPYYDPIVIKPSYMKTAADYEYVKKNYPKLYKGSPKPPHTLPLDGNEPSVDNGQVIYYKPGQRENAQTTPFVGGQNANDYIMGKYKNGGPFISNSQKINLNLPVYKQPEMKPLQFNKFFVNDKNQNLYIGGVNPRYQNKDFSVGPYMVGVGNTNFQKLPADIGMSGTYHVNDKFDINTNIGQNNIGAGIKYKFAKGGIPNNPGFNALPKYVQKRIINNYKQGGVILNTGGEKHEIYVKTTNRGEGTKGHIMVNHPTMDKGMWDTIDLTQKAGVKTIAQGVASTKKWHKENPYDMKNKKYQQGGIPYNNLDDVLKKLFG
jgi:hypothetical protein